MLITVGVYKAETKM